MAVLRDLAALVDEMAQEPDHALGRGHDREEDRDVLTEGEAAEALAALERLLAAVEAGQVECEPGEVDRLRGAVEVLREMLRP